MALRKIAVRGVRGQGVNVNEDQPELLSSHGKPLPNTQGAWHLELSDTKHVYLAHRGPVLRLIIKDFAEDGGRLLSSPRFVQMDRQQFSDFLFAAPDLLFTARRNDITRVSVFLFLQ